MQELLKKNSVVITAVITAWAVLLCFYYIYGSGERLASVFILSKRCLQIGLALMVIILAGAVGSNLLKITKCQTKEFVQDWLLGTGIGLGLLGYLVFFLGLGGVLDKHIYAVILLFFSLFGFNQICRLACKLYQRIQNIADIKFNPLCLCLVVILSLAALSYLAEALAPEVEYDALEYHLGALTNYLADGKIHFLASNVYANFPSLGEMLYLLGMVLEGDITAKLINYFLGILCVLSIIYFGKKYFSGTAGLTAAAIFYVYPLTGIVSAQVFIDLFVAFFTFLGLWSIINWFEGNNLFLSRNKWLLLSGIYCGLACSCKYTALLLTLGTIVVLMVFSYLGQFSSLFLYPSKADSRPFSIKDNMSMPGLAAGIACLTVLAIVFSSPWYIKNYISTGNPFYPLFYKVFGGLNWDNARNIRFLKAHQLSDNSLSLLIKMPWSMVTQSSTASLLFIFSLPIFIFIKKGRVLILLAVFTLIFYLCWFFFTHRVDRFLIPVLPVLSLVSGVTLCRFNNRNFVGMIIKTVLITALIFNIYIFNLIISSVSPWSVALGFETQEEFLERNLHIYKAVKFLNDNLKETDRVLLVGEARVHYLKVPFLANTVFDENIIEQVVKTSSDPVRIKQAFESRKITHILVNLAEVRRLRQTYLHYMQDFNWELFLDFSRTFLEEIYNDEQHGIAVYKLRIS